MKKFLTAVALLVAGVCRALAADGAPPDPAREFRGAWVATVANIDWPSSPHLSTDEQKRELTGILDTASRLHLNALIFQVRPECDALYDSPFEPWSEWLTGKQGRAPSPAYDPLAFAVEQAHKRGIELHAWFNPFRASHPKSTSSVAANHVTRTHPEWTRRYGKYLWLDPGDDAVRDYTLRVILDVVRRYDIDGVHLDDYFYPYPESDGEFPDDATWRRAGRPDRAEWRRENINKFVRELYRQVKAAKPWVKVGISPSGIWRSGMPRGVSGTGSYDALFADSRKWLASGWLDYFAPQLYWKIRDSEHSYAVLLSWWAGQNRLNRHLWPGVFTSKVDDGTGGAWRASEIIDQINLTHEARGAQGNIHFSMKPLLENRDDIATALRRDEYVEPALVPASPWLSSKFPAPPRLIARPRGADRFVVTWQPTGAERAWLWHVQVRYARGGWATYVLPGTQAGCSVNDDGRHPADRVAVRAVDRYGNTSAATTVELRAR